MPATAGTLLLALCLLLLPRPLPAQDPPTLRVVIEGVEGELLDNVAAFLEINRLAGQAVPYESRIRWLHARAEENIRQALQPFGHYQPEIEKSLDQTGNEWVARYRINPGPPLRIAEMTVSVEGDGNNDLAFQRILTNLPLKEGDVLVHPQYEEIKAALQNVAAERGYFDARLVRREIRVNMQEYAARVEIRFATGRRYQFGKVEFRQDVLAQEFIERYKTFNEGDPYSLPPLLKLQSALIDSQYFSRVELNASPDRATDHTLPVDVILEPRPKYKFTTGAGYGTDTGVRGRIGLENRRVNRWGHRYKVDLFASQIKFGLTADYTIPLKNPTTDQLVFRTGYTDEDSDSIDSQKFVIGASRQLQRGLWTHIYSLDFQQETFTFGDVEESSILLIPSGVWTRIKADDRLNTTEGNRIIFELRGAYEGLLSDVSFLQGVVRGKLIEPVGDDGRLILRGDIGTSLVSDFDQLPASVRFFAGGDRSVRGYSLDSIGPEEDGEVVGGKNLVIGSVEYEHRIRDKWSVAAFVDTGDAFDTESPELKTGVGLGVRWQSPVGPVRVDIAHALDEPPGDTIRLHLTIGPDL
ncbi:MAG: autotransporter assembly complex protein TamA [Pseudomonadota bacterium]|nr:autotransporter assembly complex protein TamA [Pseudomonadota bacterium]